MNAGIDHIAVYVPNQYVCLKDLVEVRKADPKKYIAALGVAEMAIASPSEDTAVLAANAGLRVLRESGVSPQDIGFLVVGTESAIDKSKPVATLVHDMLGVSKSCRVYDIVHACIGATYGVLSAIDWLRANPANQYALVIASDIARYGLNSQGEPTQGAGAVAMLVSRDPRLLALEEIGSFSANVYDFWKPMHSEYPIVNGLYSAECYINAVTGCFSGRPVDMGAAFMYHTPFPQMVKMAHAKVVEISGATIKWKEHFASNVESSLALSTRIGNIYTGSLWLSLVSFFETAPKAGREVGSYDGCYLFSYGSGCGAELLRGQFGPKWREMARHFDVSRTLDSRVKLSVEEYERTYSAKEPTGWPVHDRCYFQFDGLQNEERRYSKIAAAGETK